MDERVVLKLVFEDDSEETTKGMSRYWANMILTHWLALGIPWGNGKRVIRAKIKSIPN